MENGQPGKTKEGGKLPESGSWLLAANWVSPRKGGLSRQTDIPAGNEGSPFLPCMKSVQSRGVIARRSHQWNEEHRTGKDSRKERCKRRGMS